MDRVIHKVLIILVLLLLSVTTVFAQDVGIHDDEKLLVWMADAQRPGRHLAQNPGELVWIDKDGNFESFMNVPAQATHVMTCGYTSAYSPDGESMAFYMGADVGTLHILRGMDNVFEIDTNFHAAGCAGNGTFEFFDDNSHFAYIDYDPGSLDESYGEGFLRVYDNATFAQVASFENVTAFDEFDQDIAFVRFFKNDQNQAIETALILWDGENDREIATLFAEDKCAYNSARVKILADGRVIAVMGHRCTTGDARTNWQFYVIDPENRTATQITQVAQTGRYFAFSRTNSIFASPDGAHVYFTIPDGLTNHSAGLMLVDMSSMAMVPRIPDTIVMPRYNNNPFAAENHPSIVSPDGMWLSMVRNTANNEATLTLLDLSAADLPPIELTAGSRGSQIVEMEFSPDNSQLFYVAGGENGGDNSLWGVDLLTGNNFRINRGRYGWGVISPDGTRMALINWVPIENKPPYATLVIVDVDSSAETLLFQGGEVVNDELTAVRFALPIAWRR